MVEPLTNYFVGRAEKDFRGGATTFGGILTSTARRMNDPAVAERLRSHAEAAGFDWRHSWHRREYSWMGSALLSSVSGSPEAIAATQRSSARYFQRPDRGAARDGLFRTAYDTTATHLRGYGLFSRVGKDTGILRWEAMANVRSPGFEVNDLAYLSRADYTWLNGNVAGNWTTPTRWYRSLFASFGGATQYTFEGDRTWSQLQSFFGLELPNYWNLRLMGIHNFPAFDDRLTRGGPVVRRAGYDTRQRRGLHRPAEAPSSSTSPCRPRAASATPPARSASPPAWPSSPRPTWNNLYYEVCGHVRDDSVYRPFPVHELYNHHTSLISLLPLYFPHHNHSGIQQEKEYCF